MPEGRGTVRLGRIPAAPKWAMRREMPSQRYTTRWDERQLSAKSSRSDISAKAGLFTRRRNRAVLRSVSIL
ncbi:DUF4113 domain-containing protein [Pseudomonas sp. MTM4]|uniref:DUF4113 domain-containing protein n=1 Tax=Pseudomonas sp. MTM4 TaxID=2705472 RepID=UPI0035A990A1